MRLLAALLLLFATPASSSPIQRYLESLRLGDTMEQIRAVYPPTQEWTKQREPGSKLIRINIERGYAKWFPTKISTMSLGMRRGRLAHIKLIYDRDQSRAKPVSELVMDLSLIYGEPRRDLETYFWFDSGSVLAVSHAEVETGSGKELRTCLELMEKGVFKPLR